MSEKSPQQEELTPEEKFAQMYEGASLIPITYADLPPEAVTHFEANSEKYILPKEYIPGNFSHIYLLTHPDGSETYIAEQIKNYGEGKDTEALAYFMDYIDGKPAGYGELRNNISNQNNYFRGKPFVGFTRTYSPEDQESGGNDFQKQGLGERRLFEMNAYTESRFGAALHSDSNITPEAERVWQRFVKEGKAEAYVQPKTRDGNDVIRYRMK